MFEFDGDTGYLYLCEVEPLKILRALHVFSGAPDFTGDEVSVRWAAGDTMVGVVVRDEVRAIQLVTGEQYGAGVRTPIPADLRRAFDR